MPDPTPQLDRIRAQFTRQADAYARMRQTTDEAGLLGLVSLAGTRAGDRVLDVACGPGFLTMAFASRCGQAVGLDATEIFTARAREEAARRGLGNVEFRSGDAAALPFDAASFDVVSCRAAFHHFPEPGRVLREMARVAKPGGRVLVADMLGSEEAEKAACHDRIERLCDPTHERALPASELLRLFAEAGLEVVAQPRSTLHYDLDEWLAHGGPGEAATREIVSLLEASLETDRCGLDVRREDGRLRFSHRAIAVLARRV
ncbi:MAG TPA: methyltransferase domain-containing protein [Myxococcota bacterium]|nr:methyltransferase domain-containing protein [Myxococcota bacterium]